ncbi:MAG: hypothetical protein H7839_09465, partial [Magnetococcus sp. YQC-5]
AQLLKPHDIEQLFGIVEQKAGGIQINLPIRPQKTQQPALLCYHDRHNAIVWQLNPEPVAKPTFG